MSLKTLDHNLIWIWNTSPQIVDVYLLLHPTKPRSWDFRQGRLTAETASSERWNTSSLKTGGQANPTILNLWWWLWLWCIMGINKPPKYRLLLPCWGDNPNEFNCMFPETNFPKRVYHLTTVGYQPQSKIACLVEGMPLYYFQNGNTRMLVRFQKMCSYNMVPLLTPHIHKSDWKNIVHSGHPGLGTYTCIYIYIFKYW